MIARLGGVVLSVLLHGGLIALLLAWSAVDWTRPLFVDLVDNADAPGSPTAGPSPAPARARGPRRGDRARPVAQRRPARPGAARGTVSPDSLSGASAGGGRGAGGPIAPIASQPGDRAAGSPTGRGRPGPGRVRADRSARRPRRSVRQRLERRRRERNPDAGGC